MRMNKRHHQKVNKNRIVRVRNKKIARTLEQISHGLGMPYQTVFEEWCDMMTEGYTHGLDTHHELAHRILEKYTKGD